MHLKAAGVNTGKAYTWKAKHIFQEDVDFDQDAVGKLLRAGLGVTGQVALAANLDQDDVLIKRDVDGGGSWGEAGSVVVIQRDGTNLTDEAGNYLELQDAGGNILSRFEKAGHLILGEGVRLKCSASTVQVRNLADTLFAMASVSILDASSYVNCDTIKAKNEGNDFDLYGRTRTSDAAPKNAKFHAASAYATATTNKIGGSVEIYGGTGDGDAGQEDADGGDVKVYGGAAASDLANSDGGDVLIYGGDHGSSGNEGSVSIVNADGSTKVAEFNESKIGFFAATAVAQQLKANHNDWAAVGDVVSALVNLGLFDQV